MTRSRIVPSVSCPVINTAIFILAAVLSSTCVLAVPSDTIPDSLDGLPLVFQEDFEASVARWETTDDENWSLHQDPLSQSPNQVFGLVNRVSNYKPSVRSPHNIALIRDLELTEFVMLLHVRSTLDTGNHRDCCLFFGYQDAEHFYYVHLGAVPDPHSGQVMIVNGSPRKAITENENRVPWDDQWHHIKLVRSSLTGLIQVYFDDMTQPLMEVKDTTFGKGRIGIGSFDDKNDFDNIRIYGR
jgi:hypothetical protein